MIQQLKHKTLLYAEDDIVTQTLYKEYFEIFFGTVYLAENGQQALEIYHDKSPDVICLDINMPIISGLQVCKNIRKKDNKTKIILLTCLTDKQTLFEAVELGLSSYLEKPISELKLKQALIKLSGQFKAQSKELICSENNQYYFWDKEKQQLLRDNEPIHLTKNEKRLLELLVTSQHHILDYQQIYNYVWFDDLDKEYSERSIKSLIKRVRSKLPDNTIKNVYGLGYSINK